MAQPTIGHTQRWLRFVRRGGAPWSALVGNGYEGVGIPDIAAQGRSESACCPQRHDWLQWSGVRTSTARLTRRRYLLVSVRFREQNHHCRQLCSRPDGSNTAPLNDRAANHATKCIKAVVGERRPAMPHVVPSSRGAVVCQRCRLVAGHSVWPPLQRWCRRRRRIAAQRAFATDESLTQGTT